MENLKQALSGELEGSVFENVIGFWDKYFDSKRIKVERDGLTKKFAELSAEPKFQFPAIPTEDAVWRWMHVIENDLIKAYRNATDSITNVAASTAEERVVLAFTGAQFHTLAVGKSIGNQSKRQVDYFIKSRNLPIEDLYHWRDILVVGELTVSSSKVSRQMFLQLSVYMREVFMAQPLRRFVHGFILFEKDLQLWLRDLSGPYSCSCIDIGESLEKLVHVLVTYMLMNDEELGLDTKVKYEGENMIVHLQVPGSKETRKFILDPVQISQQKAYLCRGTSCYKDRNLSCVVKFSWRICDGLSEIELL
ncbi:BgTH12-07366 [Blumeria graminis f. sp. triticale]|uniref:BgTH12-07366 n=1 Tax=Blumeria graminis f. sp. triticale TaxID=1689686 RepID=A0A9W4D7Q3_BLUGR|nr:BgTH12-07366 [Blumeria graminis f. sp. triticale]